MNTQKDLMDETHRDQTNVDHTFSSKEGRRNKEDVGFMSALVEIPRGCCSGW